MRNPMRPLPRNQRSDTVSGVQILYRRKTPDIAIERRWQLHERLAALQDETERLIRAASLRRRQGMSSGEKERLSFLSTEIVEVRRKLRAKG